MSDVLIKGAKMPNNCVMCFYINECKAIGGGMTPEQIHSCTKQRHERCPLVEIPPHGRLIDADKLEYNSIGCWARDEVRPPQDDTEWLISKYDIDEETPTVIESEEQENE